MANAPNDPGKDKDEIIFDLVKRRYDDELQRIKDLDSKAGNLIGYVTIVTGLVIGLGAFDIIGKLSEPVEYILFFGGISSLVFSIITSFIAIRLISWDIVPEVRELTSFLDDSSFEYRTVIRQVLTPMANAVIANEASNNSKTKWITLSWYALIIGLILLLLYMAVFTVHNVIDKKPHSNITQTPNIAKKIFY